MRTDCRLYVVPMATLELQLRLHSLGSVRMFALVSNTFQKPWDAMMWFVHPGWLLIFPAPLESSNLEARLKRCSQTHGFVPQSRSTLLGNSGLCCGCIVNIQLYSI